MDALGYTGMARQGGIASARQCAGRVTDAVVEGRTRCYARPKGLSMRGSWICRAAHPTMRRSGSRISMRHGTALFWISSRLKPESRRSTRGMMTLRCMKKDITPHGFRSSFRDWAAERTSFPREVCEAALAHRLKDKMEAAYHRTDLFEKRRSLMATWAAFAKAMPAKVVPLRAGPLG